jgi:putative flippase GtrA
VRVPVNRSIAAAIVATVAVALVMAPAIAFLRVPPGIANGVMILIPNLILAVGIWVVSFLGARAIFRS